MTTIDQRYDVLRRIAREAGDMAMGFWSQRSALTVESKGPQDPVTHADKEVENFIRRELADAFPEDGFLGEETLSSYREGNDRLWIVDPIDGTHNFVHGIPYWNVSIAYVENGVRMLGAVCDPPNRQLFHARRGGGAWRSDVSSEARISVSRVASLQGALIAFGHSDRHPSERYLALRRGLMHANAVFRHFGAGALQIAHVADGRLDGYIELDVAAWDVSAGLLLVEEAGGFAGPYPGPGGLTVLAPVVVSAPAIAEGMNALVRAAQSVS